MEAAQRAGMKGAIHASDRKQHADRQNRDGIELVDAEEKHFDGSRGEPGACEPGDESDA